MGNRERVWGVVAATAVVGLLAGCSGSSSDGTASGQPSPTRTGPVSLTFWGKTTGQKAQVALWNKEHPDIHVTYVEQSASDADMVTAVQNAAKAGKTPDVFEMPRGTSVSFLVEGVTQDISKWFTNDDGAFAPDAFSWAKVGDAEVGVPYAANPTFNAINKVTFGKYGLSAPTDWTEAVEQAKKMNVDDVKSFNFPGEDPSYLRDFATQNGAEWWSADGDSWKIGFTSDASLKAGDLVQQILDADLDSNYTFIEWDALMQYFSSGKLSQFTTSTWQLPAYESNFAKSVGDWKVAHYPKEPGATNLVSPNYYNAYGVAKTASDPAAAVEFARWLSTDADSVAILADTKTGSGTFPVVADPTPYIEDLLPQKLLGSDKADAPAVVEGAVKTSRAMKDGPDQAAALQELADWWAKAVTGKVKVRDVLEHMQTWTINDLKSKNISVSE